MTDAAPEQLRILRHMLGINTPRDRDPKPYRDYYCANPGDPDLHELQRLGLVALYRSDSYEWFTTTDAGKAVAMASHKAIRYPKAKRRYIAWLSVQDAFPDLSFLDYLTRPEFEQSRRSA